MYYFFTPKTHRGLRVWDNGKKLADFVNNVDYGSFSTNDEAIAQALRDYPLFGMVIRESKDCKVPNFDKPVPVNYKVTDNGVETIVTTLETEIKEVKIDASKYIHYGELKAKLFNEKGELKKVIKTDQKEQQAQLLTEFNELKKQIEV